MTPETRTSLTTAVLVVVPVVAAIAAFAYFGPGSHHPQVGISNCSQITGGTYWGLELDYNTAPVGSPSYVLGTIDLSSRGGLKHNIEVNWMTPSQTGGGASETASEYSFNPNSDCDSNGTVMTFHADSGANLIVTLTGDGAISAQVGGQPPTWTGWISKIH